MVEVPDELTITVETTRDFVGCAVWGARRGTRSDADRDPRPRVFRSSGPVGLGEAPVALLGAGVRRQDVDRAIQHVDAQVVLTRRAGVEATATTPFSAPCQRGRSLTLACRSRV